MAVGIRNRESYLPTVRNFCITLKNISPAAYRFVRNEFDDHLPHVRTIAAWHANSNIDCAPGIIKSSIDTLKRKVDEKQITGDKLFGALLFDEVGIRKHVQFVNGQMLGFENIPGIDMSQADIATEALVFMFSATIVGIAWGIAWSICTQMYAHFDHPHSI